MTRIIVHGAGGRMGKELLRLIADSSEFILSAAVDKFGGEGVGYTSLSECDVEADVVIDFSNHVLTGEVCDFATSRKIPTIICTFPRLYTTMQC